LDFDELKIWFENRPKWLQDCARRLIEKGSLEKKDYLDSLAISKKEAIGQIVDFSGIPKGSLTCQESIKSIRLESIANICGINALCSDRPLEFGKTPICIVYGRNGSGKSGYVRLLKHACGVRNPGELLSNVFINNNKPFSAKITLTEEDQIKPINWNGKPIKELSGIEIYDTNCGLLYVNQENEVSYEPWILQLFSKLTEACTYLATLIKSEIESKVSSKPDFPNVYESTNSFIWYKNISERTTRDEIEKKTAWTSLDQKELIEINKRLAESNPSEKAIDLRRQISLIKELVNDLKNLAKSFSNYKCNEYINAKKSAEKKRKLAKEYANKVFSKAPLEGIGTDEWCLLWEAARNYSSKHAYKTEVFPYASTGARCVLCQRKLDKKSRERFISFEEYVKGELQQIAKHTEQKFKELDDLLPDIPENEIINTKMGAAGIFNQDTRAMIAKYIQTVELRKKKLLFANTITEVSELPSKKAFINLIQIARNFSRKARAYEKDALGQNRESLEEISKQLNAKKWLNQQRKSICIEIKRLISIMQLKNTLNLTNTTLLSRRKSILSEELITKAYVKRFHDELKKLKAGHISIDLQKTRTEVGKVYHRIFLKNTNTNIKTTEILSEGEFRIVSLAAFLADTEGRGSKATFIFDDPISSLDHVYEEATARRLIELCNVRQVIVFTHRLSLLGYLIKYAEKANIKRNIVCLSCYRTGQVTDLPINLKKTDKAINNLVDEHLAKAKKALEKSEIDYEHVARSLCSNIRILIERIVEKDLINEVIQRFSPEVNTKNKIGALAKITEKDCTFIDEYMTKYSRYEHSQSEEAPIPLPSPDEIEKDLNKIKSFIENLHRRNN